MAQTDERRVTGSMRGLIATTALVLLSCDGRTPPAVEPAIPGDAVFTVELWPGEGIPVIVAQRPSLALRRSPSLASVPTDTLAVSAGTRLTFDSTRFETLAAGLLTTAAALVVTGRDLGAIDHLTRDDYYRAEFPSVDELVPARASIEYLQDRAEGTCFVRLSGRVIDARVCPSLHEHVTIEREPLTRWWTFVRNDGGAAGWLIVSDSTAQVVRREF